MKITNVRGLDSNFDYVGTCENNRIYGYEWRTAMLVMYFPVGVFVPQILNIKSEYLYI